MCFDEALFNIHFLLLHMMRIYNNTRRLKIDSNEVYGYSETGEESEKGFFWHRRPNLNVNRLRQTQTID